jgi:hypothetical protein
MHSVCETHSFRRAADASGMSDDEIETLINHLAADPMAGDEIPGSGGCRKLRVAGRGKGKSGRVSRRDVLFRPVDAGVSDYRLLKR